jgi:hypothetical protein
MSVSASPGIWVNDMKLSVTHWLPALLALGCLRVLAADAEPAAPAAATDPIIAEAQQAAAAAAENEDNAAGGEAPLVEDNPAASEDTFTPTIQISEDLSVSFPVDI